MHCHGLKSFFLLSIDESDDVPLLPELIVGLRSHFAGGDVQDTERKFLLGRPETLFVMDSDKVIRLSCLDTLSKSTYTSESGRVVSRMRSFGSYVDPSFRFDGKKVLYSVFGVMSRVCLRTASVDGESDEPEASMLDTEKLEESLSVFEFHEWWSQQISLDKELETELRAVIPGIKERLRREPWCRGDPLVLPYFKFFEVPNVPEIITKATMAIPFLPLSVLNPFTGQSQFISVDIGPWSVNEKTKVERPSPTAFPPMFGLMTKLSSSSVLIGVGAWIHPNDQPASGFRASFKWALQCMKNAISSIVSDVSGIEFEIETISMNNVSDEALMLGTTFEPVSENHIFYRGPCLESSTPAMNDLSIRDSSVDDESDDDSSTMSVEKSKFFFCPFYCPPLHLLFFLSNLSFFSLFLLSFFFNFDMSLCICEQMISNNRSSAEVLDLCKSTYATDMIFGICFRHKDISFFLSVDWKFFSSFLEVFSP